MQGAMSNGGMSSPLNSVLRKTISPWYDDNPNPIAGASWPQYLKNAMVITPPRTHTTGASGLTSGTPIMLLPKNGGAVLIPTTLMVGPANASAANPNIRIGYASNSSFEISNGSSHVAYFGNAGSWKTRIGGGSQYSVATGGFFGFSSSSGGSSVNDAEMCLFRSAANTVGLYGNATPTNAQTFELYNTYTSGTSFENLRFRSVAGAAYEIGSAIGSAGGTSRNIDIGTYSSGGTFTTTLRVHTSKGLEVGGSGGSNNYIQLRGDAASWGEFGIGYNNSLGATIVYSYTGYPLVLGHMAYNRASFTSRLTIDGAGAINAAGDLLFTDATYDIGKSGATRPRDGFLSRNLTVGGTITCSSTITASDNIVTNGLLSSDRYGVSANYRFRRANGTSGSPSQVLSGQAVGALSSFGYHDTAAFHTNAGAIIYFVAAENFTSGAQGTNVQFWTTPTTSTTSAKRVTIEASGELTLEANCHIQTSGAGIKIGTATSQKIGLWNATPIVQPTTSVTASTFVGVGGIGVQSLDTFDGYTIGQIVKALRNIGILA